MHIVLVDDWAAARAACDELKRHSVLGLDIESIVGDPKQSTSLIQLAVSPHKAYVFDALALGMPLFDASHLLPILADPKTIKLCYDCRGDAEILFHHHRVRVNGLYDLQVVYTSLFQRRDDPHLKGLNAAVRAALSPETAHAFIAPKQIMKRRFSAAARAPHQQEGDMLRQRPLSDAVLRYAAADAAILLRLYDQWAQCVDADEIVFISDARARLFPRRYPMHELDFFPARRIFRAPPVARACWYK